MANIEIHGLKIAQAKTLRDKIFDLLKWSDLAVTIVHDDTQDRSGNERPFLRVSEEAAAPPAVELLIERFKMNIEVLQVRKYVSAKKPRR
jgi:hypothetical protein